MIHRFDNQWWKRSNDSLPMHVVLVSFSASYFLIDTVFVLSEIGYVVHHGVSLLCFAISSFSGKVIELVIFHLFFAEIGNVAFIAEHVLYKDGAWGVYVTTWFTLTRILWFVGIVRYQWHPMLFSKEFPRPLRFVHVITFLPSLLLSMGSLTYAFMFLRHELGYGHAGYVVVQD